jgi:4-hydroxybenzoate polyprenyltransferase
MPGQPYLIRLYIYQKERFPLLVHGPLIASFSFSAIGYSRLCRSTAGFISWPLFLLCVFTNLSLFFLLRVSDEYKDRYDDAAHRKYLPVVRGLISLSELRNTSIILFGTAVVFNALFVPALLPLLGLALGFLLLMRYEFFTGSWLKARPLWYMISHMVIIPLADVYASSYDWQLNGNAPPAGLLFFFGVSYLNGMVLEVGRKLRSPEREEPGVDSYTKVWGPSAAPVTWGILLTLNLSLAVTAARYGDAHQAVFIVLGVAYMLALVPAVLFIMKPTAVLSKTIEAASLLWALTMYLALGGIPQLRSVIAG